MPMILRAELEANIRLTPDSGLATGGLTQESGHVLKGNAPDCQAAGGAERLGGSAQPPISLNERRKRKIGNYPSSAPK
jgi:hypothetical protein